METLETISRFKVSISKKVYLCKKNHMDKRTIIGRASKLLMRHGIRSVTMDDLSRDLKISKKTLYKYFDNKADLIRQVTQEEIEIEKEEIERIERKSTNAIEGMVLVNEYVEVVFKKMNSSLMYDLNKYYHDCWQDVEDFHRGYIYDKIMMNLDRGVKEGLYRQDLKVDIIARLFIEMSLLNSLRSEDFGHDHHTVCRENFHYHMHGVATAAGLKLFYEILSKRNSKK